MDDLEKNDFGRCQVLPETILVERDGNIGMRIKGKDAQLEEKLEAWTRGDR